MLMCCNNARHALVRGCKAANQSYRVPYQASRGRCVNGRDCHWPCYKTVKQWSYFNKVKVFWGIRRSKRRLNKVWWGLLHVLDVPNRSMSLSVVAVELNCMHGWSCLSLMPFVREHADAFNLCKKTTECAAPTQIQASSVGVEIEGRVSTGMWCAGRCTQTVGCKDYVYTFLSTYCECI